MFPIDVAHSLSFGAAVADRAHASPQTSVAFSPDGSQYASGGYDGRVIVWERATNRPMWTGTHVSLVNGVRYSPSGSWLASVSADKTCRIWNASTGKLQQVFSRQPDDLNSLAWIDDDTLVTVSQDGTGRIWSVGDGSLDERVLFHSDHCMSVDASAEGVLATCGEDAVIRIWEPNGELRRNLPQVGHAEMCRWSHDGTRLAVSCDDGYVHIIDIEGELLSKIGPYEAAVKSVGWSPDDTHIAVGAYDSTIALWEVESGLRIAHWYGSQLWPRSLDFAPDGRSLITGTISVRPAVVEIASASADETEMVKPQLPTYGYNHLSVSSGLIAAGGDDSVVRVWADTAKPPREYPVGNGSLINTVALPAKDPRVLAYGTFSCEVGILSLADGQPLVTLRRAHPVNRVVWSPSGGELAVADYVGALDIYSWNGKELREVTADRGHHGAVKDVCWFAEDRLVTLSTDRTARVVTREGNTERTFTGHGELINGGSVSTIGGRTVVATVSRDRTARIYDLHTGELLAALVGHDESVKAVAWHPGGKPLLLTGSYDFTARVWTLDTVTWQVSSFERLEAHTHAISTVSWLGDCPVTAGWDATARIWTLDPAGAEARVLPVSWSGSPEVTS